MSVTTAQLHLQASLIEAMTGLVDLVARLSQQLPATTPTQAVMTANAEPWRERMSSAAITSEQGSSRCCGDSRLWDELSVVELRALLRSYPIDRSSLPAPIELLRRGELIEALNQIQCFGAAEI
jgi:hypothetical protein